MDEAHRVLVVEDDAGNRTVLTEVLAAEGYRVESATTGSQALERLGRTSPDLMVLDLTLPDMDGWTLLEIARRLLGRSLPVLILSARSDAARHARPPWVEVLGKPYDLDDVLAVVARLLRPAPCQSNRV